MWRPVLLGVGLGFSALVPAQVVQVPPNVVVVEPGIGGTAGAGQFVGHGGIVCMPDPESAPPASTFIGGTVISWQLLGDISIMANITPPTPAIQSAGATPQVKIMSYNKNLRQGFENSNPFIARSKGEVTVTYQSGACNRFITYQVLKKWTTPNPQIIGPDCWQPNQQYVYAVDIASGDNVLDQIGFDRYYWQVVDGNGNTFGTFSNNSAESSSIIFTTPSSLPVGPYTLKCCYGQCNNTAPWPGPTNNLGITVPQANTMTSCVTKTMALLPTAPLPFNVPLPTCVSTAATSFTGTVNSGGYMCQWSSSNPSWTVTASGVNNQTVTVSTLGANPGVLTLTMTGICGTITTTYPVNRQYAAPLALSSTSTCALAGTNVTVSLPLNAQNNITCWSAPAGWTTVSNGNGANSVRTFGIPAGTPAGCYTISASSCACPLGVISIQIRVKPTPPVFNPAPTLCFVQGSTTPVTYTVNSIPGVTSYTWTKPSGWGGTSTTNSITLTPNGTNVGTVSVVANACAGCSSAATTITLLFNPTTPIVTQPLCIPVGVSGTVSFAIGNTPGTYSWVFPPAFSPSGTSTGSSVSRNTTGTPGTYNCSVTNTNACGSATTNFQVILTAPPTFPVNNGPFSTISTTAIPGATYRLWNCNTSTFVAGPQASNSFPLNNPGAGNYAIVVTLPAGSGGCELWSACTPTAHSNMPTEPGGDITAPLVRDVVLSPNPSSGNIALDITGYFKTGTGQVIDASGKSVGSLIRLVPGRNMIDDLGLAPGSYTMVIELDGELETKSFVVTKF